MQAAKRIIFWVALLACICCDIIMAFSPSKSPLRMDRVITSMSVQKENLKKGPQDLMESIRNNLKTISKKALPLFLGSAFLLGSFPSDSMAVPSGGRSGGSSFRSAPRSSGTRLNSGGYSSGYSSGYRGGGGVTIAPIMPVTPFYSPFSYGYGFSPFSFFPVPINGNIILIGFLAYFAYSALTSSRTGGSSFSSMDEDTGDYDSGSLGSGATVMKIQVALDSQWSDNGNIMNTLSSLAARRGSVNGRSELASLLSEASIALLRKKSSWSAASCEGEKFKKGLLGSGNDPAKAESFFQKIAVQERAKFERESTNSDYSNREGLIKASSGAAGDVTQAVVSIVVAVRGQSAALRQVSSSVDVNTVLQTLASEALTDEGDNIMAVEVLWTPSEVGNTLSKRDLILDYPELIQL